MEASVVASGRTSRATDFLQRHPQADSVSPIKGTLERGLVAIAVFSLLSFILCSALWSYLTYKLITWRIKWKSRARAVARNIPSPPAIPELEFRAGETGPPGQAAKLIHQRNVEAIRNVEKECPNQFLILIYNLFLADMHQSAAFLVSTVWLNRDGIFIHTPACFVQGFMDSVGEVSSCCFITFIAIHTYLSVVKNYQPPQRALYLAIIGVWALAYLLPGLSLIGTMNGKKVDGFYTRSGAWCFISTGYWTFRLFTHYIFIFITIIATVALYVAIYISLRRQIRNSPQIEPRHQQAFLIYPLAFVLCTLPLAGARVAVLSGATIPLGYQTFAGAMSSANGLFDCIVFGSTRHSIIFGSAKDVTAKSTGLDTFSFMRTPAGRFGNEVWIQGNPKTHLDPNPGVGGWLSLRSNGRSKGGLEAARSITGLGSGYVGSRTQSQETLRGDTNHQQGLGPRYQHGTQQDQGCNDMVIHMDVMTTLTVEDAPITAPSIRYPEPSISGGRPSFGSWDSLCHRLERHGSAW